MSILTSVELSVMWQADAWSRGRGRARCNRAQRSDAMGTFGLARFCFESIGINLPGCRPSRSGPASATVSVHRFCMRAVAVTILCAVAQCCDSVRHGGLSVAILRAREVTGETIYSRKHERERLSRIALLPRLAAMLCMAPPSTSALLPSTHALPPICLPLFPTLCFFVHVDPATLAPHTRTQRTDHSLDFRHPLPQPPRLPRSGHPVTYQFTLALFLPSIPQRFSLADTQSHASMMPADWLLPDVPCSCPVIVRRLASEPHSRRPRGSVLDRTCSPSVNASASA